jgi:hypothetical protein
MTNTGLAPRISYRKPAKVSAPISYVHPSRVPAVDPMAGMRKVVAPLRSETGAVILVGRQTVILDGPMAGQVWEPIV